MSLKTSETTTKGSIPGRYRFLIAGVAVTCLLFIGVLGYWAFHGFGSAGDGKPNVAAHMNAPLRHEQTAPENSIKPDARVEDNKLLGNKMVGKFGVAAAVTPGSHPEDNKPIQSQNNIPIEISSRVLTLEAGKVVGPEAASAGQASLIVQGIGAVGVTPASGPVASLVRAIVTARLAEEIRSALGRIQGIDPRMQDVLGPGGGELLIPD